MGKTLRGNKEFTREQKLIHENQRLKRQVASLRKQLARIDLDRYSHVKEVIEQHYQEDRAQEGQGLLESLKQEWACHEPACGGYLEIILYNKLGNTWYFRKCTSCPHRTKAQKYEQGIKGIVKNES